MPWSLQAEGISRVGHAKNLQAGLQPVLYLFVWLLPGMAILRRKTPEAQQRMPSRSGKDQRRISSTETADTFDAQGMPGCTPAGSAE